MLCSHLPEEYGGMGADFLYSAVVIEEIGRAGLTGIGFSLHSDIRCALHPPLRQRGAEAQVPAEAGIRRDGRGHRHDRAGGRFRPARVKTTAVLDGDEYVINGSKTFITNGFLADLVIVVAKTDPKAGAKGISLFVVEAGTPGLQQGQAPGEGRDEGPGHLRAVLPGMCGFPGRTCSAKDGQGFILPDAGAAAGAPDRRYRRAGVGRGGPAMDARLHSRAQGVRQVGGGLPEYPLQACRRWLPRSRSGRVFVDRCMEQHLQGKLDVPTAAMCKYWTTDLQLQGARRMRAVARRLRLHVGISGGAGLGRCPGCSGSTPGTNEIMKEIIARAL
ncbi:putative acyl-CoA dehydrogenase [Pseudomonas aeruginosa]|nr:putative acyl-CoA dehydrogenase [Pseudomonas aeruginosa]